MTLANDLKIPDTPVPALKPIGQVSRSQQPRLIGQILTEMGELSPHDMAKAVALQTREDVRFGEILLANNMVSEAGLYQALAHQYACDVVDLNNEPSDIRLIETIGPAYCLQHGIIPWKRVGAVSLIATSRPAAFARLCPELPPEFGKTLMVVASEADLQAALLVVSFKSLALRAETRVEPAQSCSNWNAASLGRKMLIIALVVATFSAMSPGYTLAFFTTVAIAALLFNTALITP